MNADEISIPADGESREVVELSASSAVILGLLHKEGPATIYDLSAAVSVTVGFFWSIPNSQMYAEAKRLESIGYVHVVREDFGRRRKILHLNDAGREALLGWLATPTDQPVEIRDTGLLKLFFSAAQTNDGVASLAADRLLYHRARLALYAQLRDAQTGEDKWADQPVFLGLAFEQAAVDYWEKVLVDLEAD